MTEKSNAVLEEQIKQIRIELIEHKKNTRSNFDGVHKELEKLENNIDSAQKVADQVNLSMQYVTQAVNEIKTMVHGFTELVSKHNERIDKKISDQTVQLDTKISEQNVKIDTKISEQNEKIDGFINSDKRRDSKKEMFVSVLQVGAGILIAVIGFWAKGA